MVSAPDDAQDPVVSRAPGRANLIGEHTDYNDGLVLPVALELQTVIRGRPSPGIVRLTSDAYPGQVEIDPATGEGPMEGWGRHATAVVRALLDGNRSPRGLVGHVSSDVPAGTGLSSSAAFEVALALALSPEPMRAVDLAGVCQRAENHHVGVRSGIMDPLVSAAAVADAALFIDCRSLEMEPVPVPDGLRILVVDSGQRRELTAGDYNRRREECEAAAASLGVPSLRDVTIDQLEPVRLPGSLLRRARHVVTENARVLAAREALRRDDRQALRSLFADSHRSLAQDFAVSTPELDVLVEIASATPGVVASRMTGAGFGGCTVSMVDADAAASAAAGIIDAYGRRTGRIARAWVSRAAAGAIPLSR
jgi:galactokinase